MKKKELLRKIREVEFLIALGRRINNIDQPASPTSDGETAANNSLLHELGKGEPETAVSPEFLEWVKNEAGKTAVSDLEQATIDRILEDAKDQA